MEKKVLTLIFFCSFYIYAQDINERTIDISGKQRMFSQRIAKNHLLKLKGETFDDFNKQINLDKVVFGRQLSNLYKKADTNDLLQKLDAEKANWQLLLGVIKTNKIKLTTKTDQILKSSHNLFVAANDVTKAFEIALNQDNAPVINTAGKQRMLSQRLCLYYVALNIFNENKKFKQSKSIKEKLNVVFTEMDTVIDDFFDMEYINDEIESEVLMVAATFEKIKIQKESILNGTSDLKEVYEITNELLKENNILTRLLTQSF